MFALKYTVIHDVKLLQQALRTEQIESGQKPALANPKLCRPYRAWQGNVKRPERWLSHFATLGQGGRIGLAANLAGDRAGGTNAAQQNAT